SDRVPVGLRDWLRSTRPQASLRNLLVIDRDGGAMHAQGRVDALGFAAVGDAPGLSGLAGDFEGDARGLRFVFDPRRPMRFDWPRGFGVAHTVTLRGEADAWREGTGWRVATPALRVQGPDFAANARGGLWFQNDGTRPWIDLAADLDDTRVPVARGFWIRYLMPPAAVHWLDNALVGGRVEHGRALVSGDLDDWPFDNHNGRFECSARIADATLKFQPDWPAAEHVDGDVAFIADGFRVTGKGVLANVGIRHFDAGIAHFGHAALTVDADGGGDASRLLGLLRQSPLHKEYGDTLDNLGASGLAAVTFHLDLPFQEGAQSQLGGTVALAGAKMADKRWNLAFSDMRGRAEYGSGGFDAERIAVLHDGQPGRLSLRAGQYVRNPGQAFEADLDASLGAKALLAHAPDLAWLAPYLDGRSAWTASVAIGKTPAGSNAAAPSRLQLHSNLVGTRLTLPAPLHKPAGAALPAVIDAALPLGNGEVRVALGNVMALRARSGAQTGVRVELASDSVADAPPASGLVATGHAATLDALDWMTVAHGSQGSGGKGVALQHVDVGADHLHLLGGDFPDTRLQVDPVPGGLAVQMQGGALAGRLNVPDADTAPIAGHFARAHWRDIPAAGADPGDAALASADVNPAKLPPLAIDIDDLRVRDAQLGIASLRTRPLANGLRIEHFQASAPKQQLAVQGDWTGVGAAAHTRLSLAIDSQDFGALLAGFGYGGQLAGGKGRATLDAGWAGSPSAFGVGSLEGALHLDARNGQLTELEPGAGRVLGLLSIAQLPRRLTLDFRDLFEKGLAFDRLHGDVRLAGGIARTDGLAIEGPAADIRIHGAADLRAQVFDQTVEVFPKTGNLLTVAGALAGGPVGAAIGAAANAMLQKPLGRIAAKTYRVTGPWKDPRVEVISREQSRVTALRSDDGNG
ncbi:MAG: TIGR02099 family protein, partial [Lysobacter sp.]|nr:TIGR02099 family protein [Lysobacter sp.]